MKTTTSIDPRLLDNAALFQNEFFRRFALRHAEKPLQLDEKIAKNYLFPTLYGDVTCAMAIFPCDYAAAARLLPHPDVRPVRLTRGRSLVAFSCYEYKQVLGVAPYNEIAMTIPILVAPRVSVPVLPMLWNGYPGFGFYVFSMPVTSLENQIRGRRIWGLPKVVQEIDLTETNGECVTTAYEETGEPYFTLRVPTGGKPTHFDVSSHLYSRLGDAFLQSRTCFKATFNVNKYPAVLWQKGTRLADPYLRLGDTPAGRMLRELGIEDQPLQFRFAKHMSSCFDLPEPSFRSPIRFA